MGNIFSYNYDRVMDEHPDLRSRTSYEWLSSNPDCKYTTGVKGIANAYIPTGSSPLIINEKNAMYALLFAASVNRVNEDFRFYDESRNFDKMLYSLLPTDDEATKIHDAFYRRLFTRSGVKDDIRNALNSKAFERLFEYEVTSRYVCVIPAYGAGYTEDEIRRVAEDIYQDQLQSEMDQTGRIGLTTLSRCIVQEKCAIELRSKYGWEFDHREFGDVIVDEDLLEEVRRAFPHVAAVVTEMLETLDEDKNTAPSTGLMRLGSVDRNPISNFFVYQRSIELGLKINEALVDWTEEDYQQWRKHYKGTAEREEQIRDEYMHVCVHEFVVKTNGRRGVIPPVPYTHRIVDDISIYIRNMQLRLRDQ